jgi:hypothetical protein
MICVDVDTFVSLWRLNYCVVSSTFFFFSPVVIMLIRWM